MASHFIFYLFNENNKPESRQRTLSYVVLCPIHLASECWYVMYQVALLIQLIDQHMVTSSSLVWEFVCTYICIPTQKLPCRAVEFVSLNSTHSTITHYCQNGEFHCPQSGMTSFQEVTTVILGIYSQWTTMSLSVSVCGSLDSYEIIYQ